MFPLQFPTSPSAARSAPAMKNRPPNVFVSSTMYDLSELRAQLRQFVAGLGWHAVMSEHDSFPIDPDRTTIENCRRNVRENADIFVIVIGARYGSIDSASDKSVTNLEFTEARATVGVPAYVFVSRDVLAQMRVWTANPEVDFSSVVDTPRIFEFIDSFRGSGEVWTFEFATAEDVVSTLRQQFAYLVQDALEVRQTASGQDRLVAELEGDALMLALQRDSNWEIRLFGTVLEDELDRRSSLRREIEHRLASESTAFVDVLELPTWMQDRMQEVARLAQTATAVVNGYLPQALGQDGESADPLELVAAARRLAQVWEDNARWTLRCRSVRVDERAERLIDLLSCANAKMLDEIWEFGHAVIPQLDDTIAAVAAGGSPSLKMTLTQSVDEDELNALVAGLAELIQETGQSSSSLLY